jgi:hypothetical protein
MMDVSSKEPALNIRPRFDSKYEIKSQSGKRNLVDPASSHMLVSKIKPCMSQHKLLHGETAKSSLQQLQST